MTATSLPNRRQSIARLLKFFRHFRRRKHAHRTGMIQANTRQRAAHSLYINTTCRPVRKLCHRNFLPSLYNATTNVTTLLESCQSQDRMNLVSSISGAPNGNRSLRVDIPSSAHLQLFPVRRRLCAYCITSAGADSHGRSASSHWTAKPTCHARNGICPFHVRDTLDAAGMRAETAQLLARHRLFSE